MCITRLLCDAPLNNIVDETCHFLVILGHMDFLRNTVDYLKIATSLK